jgi:hypothetical protein
MMYSSRLLVPLLAMGSCALLVACGSSGTTVTPARPNPINNVQCLLSRDANFTTGIVGQDTIAAVQCPYTVATAGNGAVVRYRFRRTQASMLYSGCGNQIYNAVIYHPSASRPAYFGTNQFFTCEPGAQGQVYGSGAVVWPGGYGSTVLDTVRLAYDGRTGSAVARVAAYGKVVPSVVGDVRSFGDVKPERAATFYSSAQADSFSYFHQWKVNGAIVSGATSNNFTYTFADNTAKTIIDVLMRTDGTTFEVSRQFTPQFSAQLSGPTMLPVGQGASFSLSDPGGRAPLSYQWTLNGTLVSTSDTPWITFGSTGFQYVGVTVSDAIGRSFSTSLGVNVTECLDPQGCNGFRVESQRKPAVKP